MSSDDEGLILPGFAVDNLEEAYANGATLTATEMGSLFKSSRYFEAELLGVRQEADAWRNKCADIQRVADSNAALAVQARQERDEARAKLVELLGRVEEEIMGAVKDTSVLGEKAMQQMADDVMERIAVPLIAERDALAARLAAIRLVVDPWLTLAAEATVGPWAALPTSEIYGNPPNLEWEGPWGVIETGEDDPAIVETVFGGQGDAVFIAASRTVADALRDTLGEQ